MFPAPRDVAQFTAVEESYLCVFAGGHGPSEDPESAVNHGWAACRIISLGGTPGDVTSVLTREGLSLTEVTNVRLAAASTLCR